MKRYNIEGWSSRVDLEIVTYRPLPFTHSKAVSGLGNVLFERIDPTFRSMTAGYWPTKGSKR